MEDVRSKSKQAGIYTEAGDVDISQASVETSLSRVWSDEVSGELAVSIDRILFDGILDIAARFMEPNGFALNLENFLAIIDSMRLAVVADVSSKKQPDGRTFVKRLLPAVYMHLPRKKSVGPLLRRFYDEVGRYEGELARLQELEAKSKKVMDAAVRDESGRKAIDLLRSENSGLREELARISKKMSMMEAALKSVPLSQGDQSFPGGVRSGVVRSIRYSEGLVLVKSGDQQFSVPLKTIGGIPQVNARALSFHEGGLLKSVWVFDPVVQPFPVKLATVLAVEGRRIKIRYDDRSEQVIQIAESEGIPMTGTRMLAKFGGGFVIDLVEISGAADEALVDRIYDKQTSRQIEQIRGEGSRD